MEDLLSILRSVETLERELNEVKNAHFAELDQIFYGKASEAAAAKPTQTAVPATSNSSITPQQTKKRAKRLLPLSEDDDDQADETVEVSQLHSTRMSNSQLLAVAQEVEEDANTTGNLMPPPPAPAAASAVVAAATSAVGAAAAETSMSSGRPQRAAKLKSEKNLKEPSLNSKLRRPSQNEEVKIKLENEQRASQMHLASTTHNKQTEMQRCRQDASVVETNGVSEKQSMAQNNSVRVMVKREKMSCDASTMTNTTAGILESTRVLRNDTTVHSTTTSVSNTTTTNNTTATADNTTATADNTTATADNTTATADNTTASGPAKRGRKKKEGHRPIKVERFSELDNNLPVSARTRKGSTDTRNSQTSQAPPQRSIYEDAVEEAPAAAGGQTAVNETVTLGTAMSEATFNVPAGNTTVTVANHVPNNETFQVEAGGGAGDDDQEDSMETARQGSLAKAGSQSSLMTEDESPHLDKAIEKPSSKYQLPAEPTTYKGVKMPARTHELFNPLMQSPVKMRVEAFENAANAHSNLRPKRLKEVAKGSNTTPLIGKLPAPALGRFLTPTGNSISSAVNSAVAKKAPMSACKASSTEDFRKGLHLLADEKKKQREQKHLQAAQLREAKERERAERMAKLAKEREEKRLKKQQEKEKLEERKRQEMQELQRNMYQQEEAEQLKKAKAKEQEREMLQKMKMQEKLNAAKTKKMMPPPPKSKYTFEMLHEDDSTDDEGKVSHKRPPVPTWSRSDVRVPAIMMQSHCPTDVIDSFFSVAPTSPDLKQIFPNIDPMHLKRNSSVLWSTPPRYSELPKY